MTEGAPHEYKERPGACADCGNSPVNHFEHYISNTLAVWSAESAYKGASSLSRFVSWVFDHIEQPLLRAFSALPIARYSNEVSGATTYRSQVVWEEAQRRGIEMQQVLAFGMGTEIYRARMNGKWHYFHSLPVPRALASKSADWIDDKYLFKQALSHGGVTVPRAMSASSVQEALAAFDALGTAVVVKPRSGSRGRHTSVQIRERRDVENAFRSAQRLCRYVVVEQQLEGSVCRGTVVGGTLAGFFQADAPFVTGDGVSTIRTLIEKANASKFERVQNIVLTEEHLRFIGRYGYAPESVLASGVRQNLTHRTGRLFGGATRELLGKEHPKLRAQLERAARILETPVVGFDLIIRDPEADPDTQTWGIIEANGLPYIDLHYLPLFGEPSNVAAHVWDLWNTPVHSAFVDARARSATIQS